jgi:hypothetical protein
MAYEGFDPAKVKKRKWYEVDNPEARPYLTAEEKRKWGAQKKRRENNRRYVSSRRNTESIEMKNDASNSLAPKKKNSEKRYYKKVDGKVVEIGKGQFHQKQERRMASPVGNRNLIRSEQSKRNPKDLEEDLKKVKPSTRSLIRQAFNNMNK